MTHEQIIEAIKQAGMISFNIIRIVLFGSRSRNEHYETSDYDICIYGILTTNEREKISTYFEELPTAITFDLLYNYNILDEILRNQIEEEGIVIYQNEVFMNKKKNLENAVQRLTEACNRDIHSNDAYLDSLIKRFEFSLELSWKYLRRVLIAEGYEPTDVASPKQVIRAAYKMKIVEDGDLWIDMIDKRNLSSHTYDEANALMIADLIINEYKSAFHSVLIKLEAMGY